MTRKPVHEKRNIGGKRDGQHEFSARPHSGKRKPQASEGIAVQNLADENNAPKRHPKARDRVVPAPDIGHNPGEKQHRFECRVNRQPRMPDASGFEFAN